MNGKLKYEGKGKRLFESDVPGQLIQQFKDDATAFDGVKRERIAGKGELNCAISSFMFERLQEAGVRSHFIRREGPREMRVWELEMFPVEIVIRNIAAGSICKRLGLTEGLRLARPLSELFYKSDALHDPMIAVEHAELFGWATADEIATMRMLALRVNEVLAGLLSGVGIQLVDFKLEFGRHPDGAIVLGDEITPDGCRLWDAATGRKLDKDVFRRDLGGLSEAYHEVATRLGISVGASA
ncbi:MAG: phosphoribosylaminoimidazolesuccinocarboxamide synthase [Zetaproteobacteria bacterium]|nr:MAG: phosphoribosylaminoimidazolesuccinocarboxamide synthase [Zetaproteobacteria bacterium]